mmetsp:Transcript_3960/g.11019  ORF Transcript_3960/g.11019 Transcript_3960/m.11019 type:complete len:188 (-) Transcript_3960:208-771(-)
MGKLTGGASIFLSLCVPGTAMDPRSEAVDLWLPHGREPVLGASLESGQPSTVSELVGRMSVQVASTVSPALRGVVERSAGSLAGYTHAVKDYFFAQAASIGAVDAVSQLHVIALGLILVCCVLFLRWFNKKECKGTSSRVPLPILAQQAKVIHNRLRTQADMADKAAKAGWAIEEERMRGRGFRALH